MVKPRTYRVIVSLFLMALLNQSAVATVILMVTKPGVVWIAADSYRSGDNTWSNVCKIHDAYGGVLVKYGYDDDADGLRSTDDDVRELLASKKSFAEFGPAAANALRSHIILESSGNSVANPKTGEARKRILTLSAGLIFVTEVNGSLRVQGVEIRPVWVPAKDGLSYRVEVPVVEWSVLSELVAIYPTTLSISPMDKQHLWEHPDELETYTQWLEHQTPCITGVPNVFLKVSVHQLEAGHTYTAAELTNLMNAPTVESLVPGVCPSWSVVHIPRPDACSASEQFREDNQGILFQ